VTCDTFVCAMVGPAESVDAVASVVLNVSTLNVYTYGVVCMSLRCAAVGGVSGRRRAGGARARASEIGGAVPSHESVSPSILAVSIMS